MNICVNLALNGSSSSHCNSINRIALKLNVDEHNLYGSKVIKSYVDEEVNLMTAGNIIDLCQIRHTGQSSFRRSEIDYLQICL